jgi:hypothetical protein
MLDMLAGTSVTVTETFMVNGTPTDLDSGLPTVEVVDADNNPVSTSGLAHGGPDSGEYTFVIGAQPEVTLLAYTVAGTIGGQPQTLSGEIEVVGAPLFLLAALRALKVAGKTPFADDTVWPDAQLQEARAATLEEFQRILGFAPVPRYAREVHDGCRRVRVREGKPTGLLALTVAGTAQNVDDYQLTRSGLIRPLSGGWLASGYGNVVVAYRHGWARPQGDGANVAMLRAAMRLLPGLGSTASTVVTPDGTSYSYDPAGQLVTAGRFNNTRIQVRHFGVPAIDSWLNRWSQADLLIA